MDHPRGYIPPEERVPIAVGTYVHGFAGWHRVATVEPLQAACGMGFRGILPEHARASVDRLCPLCADRGSVA